MPFADFSLVIFNRRFGFCGAGQLGRVQHSQCRCSLSLPLAAALASVPSCLDTLQLVFTGCHRTPLPPARRLRRGCGQAWRQLSSCQSAMQTRCLRWAALLVGLRCSQGKLQRLTDASGKCCWHASHDGVCSECQRARLRLCQCARTDCLAAHGLQGMLPLEEIKRRVSQFTATGLPLVVTQARAPLVACALPCLPLPLWRGTVQPGCSCAAVARAPACLRPRAPCLFACPQALLSAQMSEPSCQNRFHRVCLFACAQAPLFTQKADLFHESVFVVGCASCAWCRAAVLLVACPPAQMGRPASCRQRCMHCSHRTLLPRALCCAAPGRAFLRAAPLCVQGARFAPPCVCAGTTQRFGW